MTTIQNIMSFEDVVRNMEAHGMKIPPQREYIKIPHANMILKNAMDYFLSLEGRKCIWLPEYDKVADWLTDNQGKGLFMFGNCGRGKTILSRYAIPAILLKYKQLVVSTFDAQEMNADIDKVLTKHIVSLDDIGTEDIAVSYGNKRAAFAEIMDMAEKKGNLLIISTNLGDNELKERYGERIRDRIISTTRRILFTGKSLRQ